MFTTPIIQHFKNDDRLQSDAKSWWAWRNNEETDPWSAFESCFKATAEFRSLAYHRIVKIGGVDKREFPKSLARRENLAIATDDIGGGFRIQHGFSTFILAAKIGENCHVNQNVTIGQNKRGRPTIGNGVSIHTGAVVVGNIEIGDNVTIAPLAFVNFDVPAGKKVFPARAVII